MVLVLEKMFMVDLVDMVHLKMGIHIRAGTNKSFSNGQGFGISSHHTISSSGGGCCWYGGGASNKSNYNTGGAGGSGYAFVCLHN